MADPATIGTAIGLGIPLAISEILPFIQAIPGNGILHSIVLSLVACLQAVETTEKPTSSTAVTTPPATTAAKT